MQRLAERLGFTKMSLYRYVPGKAELTALMLDAAMGTPPDPTAGRGSDWRRAAGSGRTRSSQRYSAHPWAIDLTTGARPVGPNELGWMETALIALAGTGLTGSERLDTIVLLNGHVRSLVEQLAPPNASAENYATQLADTMGAVGHRYPAATAAFTEEAAEAQPSNALQFGIDRILDGLAVLIDQRS